MHTDIRTRSILGNQVRAGRRPARAWFKNIIMYNSARSSQSPFYWQKYQLLKKEIQKECCKASTNYVNDNGHVNKKITDFH